MYWVRYYCPSRPADGWQYSRSPYPDLATASGWADTMLDPRKPNAVAQVVDEGGSVHYERTGAQAAGAATGGWWA